VTVVTVNLDLCRSYSNDLLKDLAGRARKLAKEGRVGTMESLRASERRIGSNDDQGGFADGPGGPTDEGTKAAAPGVRPLCRLADRHKLGAGAGDEP
jgi:hypothetical protein